MCWSDMTWFPDCIWGAFNKDIYTCTCSCFPRNWPRWSMPRDLKIIDQCQVPWCLPLDGFNGPSQVMRHLFSVHRRWHQRNEKRIQNLAWHLKHQRLCYKNTHWSTAKLLNSLITLRPAGVNLSMSVSWWLWWLFDLTQQSPIWMAQSIPNLVSYS